MVALPDLRSRVSEDRVRNRDVEEEVGQHQVPDAVVEESRCPRSRGLARADEIAQDELIRQRRPLNTNQMPAAINPAPAINDTACPLKVTFSARIKIAIAAIHDTFITPPTNSSAINVQQQPTQ